MHSTLRLTNLTLLMLFSVPSPTGRPSEKTIASCPCPRVDHSLSPPSPPGLPWGILGGYPFFSSQGHFMRPYEVRLVFRWASFLRFRLFSFFCLSVVHSSAFFFLKLSLMPALSSVPSIGCLSASAVWTMYISIFVYCIYLGRCREIGRRSLGANIMENSVIGW